MPSIAPTFGPAGTVVVAVLVAFLLVSSLLPRARHGLERLRRARETDPRALVKRYRRVIVQVSVLGLLVLAVPIVDPGVTFADIGFAVPGPDFVAAAVLVVVVVLAMLLRLVQDRRRVQSGGRLRYEQVHQRLASLTPRTGEERWLAAGVALVVGIAEELIFRGLYVAAGIGLLHLSFFAAAGLSVLLFGVTHLYQGLIGAVNSMAIAVMLTALYFLGGNLVLPIALHVLWDMVALLVVPRMHAPAQPRPEPVAGPVG